MAACGFFAEHIGGGHLSFTPFLYLPLILWAFRRGLRDVRYGVVVAGLFALTVLEGGTYPAPLMAVALAVECLARLGSADDRRALARLLPVIVVLFVLLAAVRLLPALHYLREHPRLEPLDDGLDLGEVLSFWTTRTHARGCPGTVTSGPSTTTTWGSYRWRSCCSGCWSPSLRAMAPGVSGGSIWPSSWR